jgi:hypothetical protein
LLIQVSSRPGCGAAQPAMTALKAVSTVTLKISERNQAAHFRLDPEQRRITGALGHREDAAGIGPQQHLGRDFGNG